MSKFSHDNLFRGEMRGSRRASPLRNHLKPPTQANLSSLLYSGACSVKEILLPRTESLVCTWTRSSLCLTVILELPLDIVLSELSMLPPISLGKLVNLQIIFLMKEAETDLFNKWDLNCIFYSNSLNIFKKLPFPSHEENKLNPCSQWFT